jgi:hypothetical protein
MRLFRVNDEKVDLIAVHPVEIIVGGTLPPERWSGIRAIDQRNRFFLKQLRKDIGFSIDIHQGELNCWVAFPEFMGGLIAPKAATHQLH